MILMVKVNMNVTWKMENMETVVTLRGQLLSKSDNDHLFLNENGGDDDDGDCTDKTLSETIKHKN